MSFAESEEDYEIDASSVIHLGPQPLDSVNSLDEALGKFGYTKDDKLARTEVALIYNKIKRDFIRRINEIAENRYTRNDLTQCYI